MASSSRAAPPFVHLAAHPVRWRLLTTLAGGDHRVRELVALVGEPQNLVSYHLRLLRDGGLVTAARSSFDGRDSYYRLDLDRCAQVLSATGVALHPALRTRPAPSPPFTTAHARTPSVLFLCTGNSARSPIAEALLRQHTGGAVQVASAGSRPAPRVHPDAVRVLREEFGIDIGDRRPRHLDTLSEQRFDHVITLCDKVREVCPEYPRPTRRAHWSTPDPAAAGNGHSDGDRTSYPAFRRTAGDIDTRIRHLLPVLATPQEAQP
ncbi:ArsR family transcriptional regulator [Streptomyces sp. NPDC057616]|uniref:arsenate reductase/protein-tyrosine-phosphatase family protein n=1 Tax=Streptomyces sp. NPDC057616 TaxID=3346183 RepID=UPI0036B5E8B6